MAIQVFVMEPSLTLSVTEFKARCLEFFERLSNHEIDELVITKRGKPIAVVCQPKTTEQAVREAYGSLRGSVIIPDGFDLTTPAFDGELDAEFGILHQ